MSRKDLSGATEAQSTEAIQAPVVPVAPAHSSKPRLLDLFCGAGGATKGYQQAGFYVVGVDINPQPNYCGDEFWRGDAVGLLEQMLDNRYGVEVSGTIGSERWLWLGEYAAIHASPPCQAYSDLQKRTKREYPELIEPTRELLRKTGLPYVIENVEGAPLIDPVTICGTIFPSLRVIRHRLFETNWPLKQPYHPKKHPLVFTHDKRKAHYGKLDQDTSYVQVTGGGNCTVANKRAAMGIDWMTGKELNEAIPPAYTAWVGFHLRGHLLKTCMNCHATRATRDGYCAACFELSPVEEFAA